MRAVAVGGAVLGAALVLATVASVISTLVVPRRSRSRVPRAVDAAVDGLYRLVTRRTSGFAARDRVLASQAPTTILATLASWLLVAYTGFSLLLWPFDPVGLGHAAAQAGSSLFTLGYAGPDSAPLTVIDYTAAAFGLVTVALQTGYLPTLYSAFNRREVEVTLLTSRAGIPAWGPEVLARTRFGFGEQDEGVVMDAFYLSWERWAADVAESHTNYPVLTRFRSPGVLTDWLVGLVAVLDSAALWLAVAPSRAPVVEARLCLRMGFVALRYLGDSLGLDVDHDPDPDTALQLSYEDYLAGIERLVTAGFVLERTPEQAWPDFCGWRINYETVAYALARRLDAVPAPWTGPRRSGAPTMSPVRPANRMPTPYAPPTPASTPSTTVGPSGPPGPPDG